VSPATSKAMQSDPSQKQGGLTLLVLNSYLSKSPFKELPCLSHMFLYIRLQMRRPRLPIVCRIADTACEKDELF
jgi:hypothetical protein